MTRKNKVTTRLAIQVLLLIKLLFFCWDGFHGSFFWSWLPDLFNFILNRIFDAVIQQCHFFPEVIPVEFVWIVDLMGLDVNNKWSKNKDKGQEANREDQNRWLLWCHSREVNWNSHHDCWQDLLCTSCFNTTSILFSSMHKLKVCCCLDLKMKRFENI